MLQGLVLYMTDIIKKFSIQNNITEEQTLHILKNRAEEDLICKCGKLKLTFPACGKYIGLYRCCGDRECEPNYGKKRPEHSALMKQHAIDGKNSGNYKKGRINDFVNTIEWKRTVLENKKLIHPLDVIDNESIEMLHKKFLSTQQKSRIQREKMVVNFCLKHNIKDYNLDTLSDLNDQEFDKIYYQYKSAHHEMYCSDVCVAKKFKRSLLENLKYNLSSVTAIYTKSSYETNYIKYFEKHKIKWSYEPENFQLDDCKYKPDFLVEYQGKKYIIEVKGWLVDESVYFNKKIYPLIKILKGRGIKLLFSYQSCPEEDFNQFIEKNGVNEHAAN